MNTNEQLTVTNTYSGNGQWALSGCYSNCWTISGNADAYADTLYCKMTNPNQNDCNFTYDYLVWRAFKTPGSFNGNVEQWCYCCGESPGSVVWVSCKINLGTCDGVNGCGLAPNKENNSPIYKSYNQTPLEASASDQGLGTYFQMLKDNMTNLMISPNPAVGTANVSYNIVNAGLVTVNVYNSLGQLVKVLVSETQAEGNYSLYWDLKDQKGAIVPKGNYLVRIESAEGAQTQSFAVNR